jgi:hypothetical protein
VVRAGRDHPPEGHGVGKRCGEQRKRTAGPQPVLEELLGDPGDGVLVATLSS